jgi:hypothetical protein
MTGGIRLVSRGPYQVARNVRSPTATDGGSTSARFEAICPSGTCRRNPSSVSIWAAMMSNATAFWKPAMTGDGMYRMSPPSRSAPNSAWKTPDAITTKKTSVSVR